MLTVTYVECRI